MKSQRVKSFKPALLLGAAVAFSPSLLACDTDFIFSESERLVSQGRHFAAIKWLLNQEQCQHPRMQLELGQLYADTGQPEKAVAVWESVLSDDNLPEVVAAKVKLAIIQARATPVTPGAVNALLSSAHQYDAQDGQQSTLSASLIARKTLTPFNAAGYLTTPQVHGQAAISQTYDWQNTSPDTIANLSSGIALRTQPLTLKSNVGLLVANQQVSPALAAIVEAGGGNGKLLSKIQWRTTQKTLSIEETYRYATEKTRLQIQVVTENANSQWRWQEASVAVQGRTQLRPELSLTWLPQDSLVRTDASARLHLTPALWLTAAAGSTLTATPQVDARVALNWRVF